MNKLTEIIPLNTNKSVSFFYFYKKKLKLIETKIVFEDVKDEFDFLEYIKNLKHYGRSDSLREVVDFKHLLSITLTNLKIPNKLFKLTVNNTYIGVCEIIKSDIYDADNTYPNAPVIENERGIKIKEIISNFKVRK